ncbi:pseudouridine synthase [Isoalcanivorax pacificus W11-5]|uniref:Pseudouridine synthase n=1 Tax=Isoalcanivorax pacificus W11-5 TaxID=391936 RepID=A0A0B4XLT5_9GAMM|nr:RluA family pseudouridine synthase [Isoalcanivorax pacificus]AJD48091.1 pseudouridine synthase [Isoalcanivorax pacificus W11-5]
MSQTPESPSGSPGVSHVRISDDRAGQRLDNFLMATLKGVPKSRIYRIIRDGQVRVNGRRAKQTQRLEEGDEVRIPPVRVASDSGPPPAVGQGLSERLSRSLIHEDNWLYIYNKPAGLAVHGGSGISLGLIETLRALYPAEAASLELVHRLDRDTSGAIMVARHRAFLRRLQRLMQGGGVEKRYWLLCRGFKGTQKTIEAPLLKQTHGNERVVRVSREGKASRTDFRVLERFGDVALVEAVLATGRTHQIRVHAQFGGFPLLGDDKYGDADVNSALAEQVGSRRMFLHARLLALRHPETGRELRVEAPLDEAFEEALVRLRGGPAALPASPPTPKPASGEMQRPRAQVKKAAPPARGGRKPAGKPTGKPPGRRSRSRG